MIDHKFPQYRKYKNGKSYFKISSLEQFEELKILPGGYFERHMFSVKILPDRNFIMDMLNDYENYWIKIDHKEYESINIQTSK